ncbi:Phosphoenolpyruvate-protein phosphotransferase [Saezia sanguinis]|uniref:Phosphoenolpyruvate-protein phosphotransferase n=1 Tax=Saezia sanguinis TaxID=1965230 RepID=A0A433SEB7_9BURK|nr:phosphoenolpyruvate--protein phosphotransferase [Saezia sanguinis]RUS67065.1 Phosphoenolpyruvate-protein phosphotransferase [Saezia sanguinis]
MAFTLFGIPVSRGIAIGRAVVLSSRSHDIDHYFIDAGQEQQELQRLLRARDAVLEELQTLRTQMPKDTPAEVAAILDVHIMMLHDSMLTDGIQHWIEERHYNAEWALDTQLKTLTRQFEKMEDEYLRERRADLEQIANLLQNALTGQKYGNQPACAALGASEAGTDPLIMVAHDISPADMLHFKQSVFTGFITDVGGKTSHSAIVARSLGIPALVGSRYASRLIRQDDWIVIDGDAGVVLVDPTPLLLEEYQFRQRQFSIESEKLNRLRHTPAITLDSQDIEILANIEQPQDAVKANEAAVAGIGLFRTEFLFMNRTGSQQQMPDEQEQYLAYKTALEAMPDKPVVIRTIDIGADKPLDYGENNHALNPALGLRAIRWSLSEPDIFLVQLRALLRAAVHGQLHILIPMLTHTWQIRQTLTLLERAREALNSEGIPYGNAKIGAMIEVPAAALILPTFLRYFDFLSVGTNDLIQYTLAIDRADESVAHLFDPLHPAVLRLLADTIAQSHAAGKAVSVCGEMAGDTTMTRLLLGLGLRSFSMHPSQILAVKKEILHSDTQQLAPLAQKVLQAEDTEQLNDAMQALHNA